MEIVILRYNNGKEKHPVKLGFREKTIKIGDYLFPGRMTSIMS